jgi:membrane-bound transcription factor site-1 protease
LRDSLLNSDYPYEWNGDHIFTNYVHLHQRLTEAGYFVELLTESFTCFSAENYKVLLILDPEDYFSKAEILKLRSDIEQHSLSLVIVADWYNQDLMKRNTFFNNNTFELWTPFMAGSNVPSLNALLQPYDIALGEKVFSGEFYLEKRQVMVDSGTEIIRFPQGGHLLSAQLSEESIQILTKGLQFEEAFGVERVDLNIDSSERLVPTIGVVEGLPGFENSGSIIVMTDSSCIDSSSPSLTKCYWLLERFVKIASGELTDDSMLLAGKYLLPKDYQSNERPKF